MPLPAGIKSVEELAVEGKRVFVRVDYNVPLERAASPTGDKKAKTVGDDARIKATLPTLKHLIERGARIVIGSHLGRPDGQVKPEYTLEPVAARLAELLGMDIALADEPVGDGARKVVSDLRDGQIAMLENLRFNAGEEANDESFARTLASYCDVYVNDAFGTAHRAHASTSGMVKFVGDKGAGFVMANSASDTRGSEAEIRRRLIDDRAVDVMVAISSNFFFTVTLPVTLWFLDKAKRGTDRAESVLFIDARKTSIRSTGRTASFCPRRSNSSPTLFGSTEARNPRKRREVPPASRSCFPTVDTRTCPDSASW